MDDEPIVIDVSALSPTQREALETVGFTGTTLTITGALRVCVEESLGTERLDAVAKGSVPSPLEVVKLMPCLRK
jgi:hypothetical protein